MTNSVADRKKALEAMLAKNKDAGTEAGQSLIFVNRISGAGKKLKKATRRTSVPSPFLPHQPLEEEDQAKILKLEEELKAKKKLEQEQQRQREEEEEEELRRRRTEELRLAEQRKKEEEELQKQKLLQQQEQQRKEEEEERKRLAVAAEQRRLAAAAATVQSKESDEETKKMLQDKLEQHKASLVSSDTLAVGGEIDDPLVEEELARKTEEYKKILEIKLAAKEKRRQALEDKLSANKAVKIGRQLLESNNMFTPEMRQRTLATNQAIIESKRKMEEHKKAYDKVIGFMKARIEKHNEETEESTRVVEAQKAAIKAEKEHAKAVKAVKKLEDQRKREEYEKRRERRASTGFAARQQ